jgi:hypothetical protein
MVVQQQQLSHYPVANIIILPYKEEVAGLNPASPTLKKYPFAGKT